MYTSLSLSLSLYIYIYIYCLFFCMFSDSFLKCSILSNMFISQLQDVGHSEAVAAGARGGPRLCYATGDRRVL